MLLPRDLRSPALFLIESAFMSACCVLAILIRFGGHGGGNVLRSQRGWTTVLIVTATVQAGFYLFDLYDSERINRKSIMVLGIVQAVGAATMICALAWYIVPSLLLGRGTLLITFLLMSLVMIYWRLFLMWFLRNPRFAERILILGTDSDAVELAREILNRKELGYEVIGFLGCDPALVGKSLINPRVIGVYGDLEDVVSRFRADRIVVTGPDARQQLPLEPLMALKLRADVSIEESVSFYERLTGKINTQMLRPRWLIFSSSADFLKVYRRVVRVLELVISLVIFTLTFPLMLLVSLLIRIDSKGPVFYKQNRVGRHNKVFKIVKFRSMTVDAEKNGAVWASEVDPRITRVGRVIRKTRIDELPQLWNVIRGEMNLIGPRPERPEFVCDLEKQIPYYTQRHLVKPGLTGWAQVRYRYGNSLEDAQEKLKYDLYYIKNQSPFLDAFILFETARIVIFGRGAR